MDHFSRKVIGFALFKQPPAATDITAALGQACKATGGNPKYIISDKGSQFFPIKAKPENRRNHPYLKWCGKKEVKPRFGAIGKYGSIAIIERFNRTLKTECTRRIFVPFNFNDMRKELAIFITWYNEFRPHQYLRSRTPEEVYANAPPVEKMKVASNSQLPRLTLHVGYFEGRKHLPVIEIKRAA